MGMVDGLLDRLRVDSPHDSRGSDRSGGELRSEHADRATRQQFVRYRGGEFLHRQAAGSPHRPTSTYSPTETTSCRTTSRATGRTPRSTSPGDTTGTDNCSSGNTFGTSFPPERRLPPLLRRVAVV